MSEIGKQKRSSFKINVAAALVANVVNTFHVYMHSLDSHIQGHSTFSHFAHEQFS